MEATLEDGLLTLDEENALNRYMDHFGLTQPQLDQNGALTQVVKAAAIRDIAEGIVPDRQNIAGRVPFNLMKSEKLVWLMQDVDYMEVVTRREHRTSSHGLSIQVARRVYGLFTFREEYRAKAGQVNDRPPTRHLAMSDVDCPKPTQ